LTQHSKGLLLREPGIGRISVEVTGKT
jgi:hypothetical protein